MSESGSRVEFEPSSMKQDLDYFFKTQPNLPKGIVSAIKHIAHVMVLGEGILNRRLIHSMFIFPKGDAAAFLNRALFNSGYICVKIGKRYELRQKMSGSYRCTPLSPEDPIILINKIDSIRGASEVKPALRHIAHMAENGKRVLKTNLIEMFSILAWEAWIELATNALSTVGLKLVFKNGYHFMTIILDPSVPASQTPSSDLSGPLVEDTDLDDFFSQLGTVDDWTPSQPLLSASDCDVLWNDLVTSELGNVAQQVEGTMSES